MKSRSETARTNAVGFNFGSFVLAAAVASQGRGGIGGRVRRLVPAHRVYCIVNECSKVSFRKGERISGVDRGSVTLDVGTRNVGAGGAIAR